MSTFKDVETKREIDDSRALVNDFRRRPPYWSYRPVGYVPLKEFMEFQKIIDEHLNALFAGNIDDGNGDVLDNLIRDITCKAAEDLALQKVKHNNTIHDLVRRVEGDRDVFDDEQAKLKTLLSENDERLKQIGKKINKNEYFVGGESNEK